MIELKMGALPRIPTADWPEPRIFKNTINSSIDILLSMQEIESEPVVPFSDMIKWCICGNSGSKVETTIAVQEINRVVGLVCKNCNGVIKYWWLDCRSEIEE